MKDKKTEPTLQETAPAYKAGAKRTRRRKPTAPAWDFWHPPTVEQLIKEQGVKPLTEESFKKADFWPEDQDVEEFIALAKGERDPL